MEISPVTITFGTGANTESTGFIQKCDESQDGNLIQYRISYKTDDGEDNLVFSYNRLSKEIQLKNQRTFTWHQLVAR
ncbi:MAG: hypothetical protein JSS69_01665 [Acidobacteria bacterium]|nr:hypothetical protein [Acidobacteriota bacterium]